MKSSIFLLIIALLVYPAILYRVAAEPHGVYIKSPDRHGEPPYIRIAVFHNVDSLSLKINGSYGIYSTRTGKRLLQGKSVKAALGICGRGISLGETVFDTAEIIVRPVDTKDIYLNNKRFRGEMRVMKRNGSLLAVNYVRLEDYIKGIFIRESSHYWPTEVLKAEALIFRSFALYRAKENAGKDYDVTSDVYSQVYGGISAERFRTNKVVEDTAGMLLAYKGKVFPAYYHSACGGRTENASFLWNINISALKGVACDYCVDSPHYRWSNVLANKEIAAKLHAEDASGIPQVTAVAAGRRDQSGRLIDLTFFFDDFGIRTISAKAFRQMIGPDIIKSTNFEARLSGDSIVFEGFGWGHGVGLCQWGAYFMAKHGSSYQDILSFYYPGTQIIKVEELK